MNDSTFKECPFCREQIPWTAIKCRYCAEWLELPLMPDVDDRSSRRPSSENGSGATAAAVPAKAKPIPAFPAIYPTAKRANYFVRHWRGDLSLGITYWVNGFLGLLAVTCLIVALAALSGYVSLKWVAITTILSYALAMSFSVWQSVGIWRSAGKHVARGGTFGWAMAARAIVLLGVWNSLYFTIRTIIPQSADMLAILAGDPSIPPYHITVSPDGTEIEFRGGLRAGSAREFEKLLADVPEAKVLEIESTGGRMREGTAIGKLIHERGMTTYTADYCMSAATLILISGKERVVDQGARVGFHSGSLAGATRDQQNDMAQGLRETMVSAGVSPAFIGHVLQTPPDQMWYPTYDEMRAAGVVTRQSVADPFASAHWQNLDWQTMAEKLGSYPIYRKIKEADPATYDRLIKNAAAILRAGKPITEATASLTGTIDRLIQQYFTSASDEAVLEVHNLWIMVLARYKDTCSPGCIAFLTDGKANFKKIFPDWNPADSVKVMEDLIDSGAGHAVVATDALAVADDMTLALRPVIARFGDNVSLLSNPKQWPGHSRLVCEMLLMFYQQMDALPVHHRANLTRYLYAGGAIQSADGSSTDR
jgi:hypothetical protein